jgi:hypothetical protein
MGGTVLINVDLTNAKNLESYSTCQKAS